MLDIGITSYTSAKVVGAKGDIQRSRLFLAVCEEEGTNFKQKIADVILPSAATFATDKSAGTCVASWSQGCHQSRREKVPLDRRNGCSGIVPTQVQECLKARPHSLP